jgi:deoxyribose-phosphate aldolase
MKKDIAHLIDHTLLVPDAKEEDIRRLVEEAKRFGFASCCANPHWIPLVAKLLKGTSIKVCGVVGFPLGANKPKVKALEARTCVKDGANEIDMVMNIGAFLSGDYATVGADIRGVVEASGVPVKVIIETGLLNDEQKIKACKIAESAGAAFVKTSTGFSSSGATAHDVRLMREAVGKSVGVKAAGGIKSYEKALEMLEAGATRIGASASIKIVS